MGVTGLEVEHDGKGSNAGLVTMQPFRQEMTPEGKCWPEKRGSRGWQRTAELRVIGLNSESEGGAKDRAPVAAEKEAESPGPGQAGQLRGRGHRTLPPAFPALLAVSPSFTLL